MTQRCNTRTNLTIDRPILSQCHTTSHYLPETGWYLFLLKSSGFKWIIRSTKERLSAARLRKGKSLVQVSLISPVAVLSSQQEIDLPIPLWSTFMNSRAPCPHSENVYIRDTYDLLSFSLHKISLQTHFPCINGKIIQSQLSPTRRITMHFIIALSAMTALLPTSMSVATPGPEVNININLPVGLSLVSHSCGNKAVYSPV